MAASTVVVLNASYEVINVVSVAKAITYVLKEKAEVVYADTMKVIRSATKSIPFPKIVRLLRYVRIPYRSVVPRWSRWGVLQRDRATCAYCGSLRASTIDHVLPKSKGGRDNWLNTVSCCSPCNNSKGSRSLTEAGMRLLFEPYEPKYRASILIAVSSFDRGELESLGVVLG